MSHFCNYCGFLPQLMCNLCISIYIFHLPTHFDWLSIRVFLLSIRSLINFFFALYKVINKLEKLSHGLGIMNYFFSTMKPVFLSIFLYLCSFHFFVLGGLAPLLLQFGSWSVFFLTTLHTDFH